MTTCKCGAAVESRAGYCANCRRAYQSAHTAKERAIWRTMPERIDLLAAWNEEGHGDPDYVRRKIREEWEAEADGPYEAHIDAREER